MKGSETKRANLIGVATHIVVGIDNGRCLELGAAQSYIIGVSDNETATRALGTTLTTLVAKSLPRLAPRAPRKNYCRKGERREPRSQERK